MDQETDNSPVATPAEEVPVVSIEEDGKRNSAEFFKSMARSRRAVLSLIDDYKLLKIDNKTLEEWNSIFAIKIPKSPDSSDIKELLSKCSSLYEYASFKFEESTLVSSALSRELDDVSSKRFRALKSSRSGTKAPSNDELKYQIEAENTEIHNQKMLADYLTFFWQTKRERLTFVRRTLETLSYTVGQELKNAPVIQRED